MCVLGIFWITGYYLNRVCKCAMKRTRPFKTYNNRPFKKPRTTATMTRAALPRALPMRTYRNSRVPLASRGYRPNSHERKAYDFGGGVPGVGAATPSQVTTASTRVPIFIPTQGSDMFQRIGRRVTIRSIQVRGSMYLEQSSTLAVGQTVQQDGKVMLIYDAQSNGQLATAAEIWSVAGTPFSFMNLNNRDRFKVLKTESFTFDPIIISATTNESVACLNNTSFDFDWYIKCNLDVTFNGTNAGTVADIATGNLILAFIGSSGASPNDVNALWVSRVRYSDD